MPTNKTIKALEQALITPVRLAGLANPRYQLTERMQHHNVPAVSMALIDKGQIAWTHSWVLPGSEQQAITPATLFQAASMSKPVAALGAMRLVEQGKLKLDQPINHSLTSWQLPDNPFTQQTPVSLRHLLSHSAGTTVHGFAGYAEPYTQPTAVEVLAGGDNSNSEPVRVDCLPGSRFRYSGGGSTVFQQAMADVTQTDFSQLMAQLVLQPAAMHNSTFAQPLPQALHPKAATGHLADGSPLTQRFNSYPEQAAAGLWCTAEDLAKFTLAVMHCQQHSSDALLSPALSQAYLSEQIEGPMGAWGLGFGLYKKDGKVIGFHHGGANAGFRGKTVGLLNGSGAVVMTNGEGGNGLISEILTATAELYDWPALKQQEKTWQALEPEALQHFTGNYEYPDAEGELSHSVKAADQGLIINGYFFNNTLLYFEKNEAGKDYFTAANGASVVFSSEEHSFTVAGYTLRRGALG